MLTVLDLQNNYVELAASIVNSGIKENDIRFLASEWCKYLIHEVVDWNNRSDKPVCLLNSNYSRTGGKE